MPRKPMENVERYPSGRIKYKRDLQTEYATRKEKQRLITASVTPEIANAFDTKLSIEGSNRNAKIKGWILDYLSGKLK